MATKKNDIDPKEVTAKFYSKRNRRVDILENKKDTLEKPEDGINEKDTSENHEDIINDSENLNHKLKASTEFYNELKTSKKTINLQQGLSKDLDTLSQMKNTPVNELICAILANYINSEKKAMTEYREFMKKFNKE